MTKKNLLLWTTNFWPEKTGIGKYNGELSTALSLRGHCVRVITTLPYYPAWKAERGSFRVFRWEAYGPGVEVLRVPTLLIGKPGGLLCRLVLEISFSLLSLPVVLREIGRRKSVVATVEPSLFPAFLLALCRPWLRFRSWLHVQDLQIELAKKLNFVPAFLGGFLARVNRFVYSSFDVVSSISPRMCEEVGSLCDRPVDLFPNWVEPPFFDHRSAPPTTTVVLYSGSIGRKQGLENLVEAARILGGEGGSEFIVCGAGPGLAEIRAASERQGLANIRFLAPVAAAEFPDLLGTATLHLVLQKREASDLVFPSKLTTILAMGGVALVTADPGTQLGQLILREKVGVLVPPDDPAALAEAIRKTLADPALRQRMAHAARAYADRHWRSAAIIDEIERRILRDSPGTREANP